METRRQAHHPPQWVEYNKAMRDRQVNLGYSKPRDVFGGSSARTIVGSHSAGTRLAELQLEEIDFAKLTAKKPEQCAHDFIVGIFR